MLRLLFTRRWLAALAAAAVLAVASYHLGVWQWGRHEAKVQRNALLDAHYRAAPVAVASVLPDGSPLREDQDWTRVQSRGSYPDLPQLLVRNRVRGSATGYEVLAAFAIPDGRLLVVDRGWVPASAEGAAARPDVPPVPEGDVTVTGWLRPSEKADRRRMPQDQLATLNLAAAATAWGTPVLGASLDLQTERPPGSTASRRPLPLEEPSRDLGPHQAYAYQWWLFMVAGFVLVFLGIRREQRDSDPGYVPKPKKTRIWDEEDE